MQQYKLKYQRGATLVLSLVFMLGMLGMIGLALDTGHVLVNKDRFQSAMDAAALSAAITRNGESNNSIAEATAAGIVTFNLFKLSDGNAEIATVELKATDFLYSDRVNKFFDGVGTGDTAVFVRVSSNALQINNFFIQVATGNPTETVTAVSTAGPVGQNCDLVPLVVCADVDSVTGNMDKDCSDKDPTELGIKECYGYNMGEETELHTKFCAPNDTACQDIALEAGNFTLLSFDDSASGNTINGSLAGTNNICQIDAELETAPGKKVGPVADGVNTRFNNDTVTTIYDNNSHPTLATPAYTTYLSEQAQAELDGVLGIKDNRAVAVPVGDCTGLQNGNKTFDFATDGSGNMAAMCVLIRRPVRQTGPDNDPDYLKNSIYIEMMELCPALGDTNPNNPVIFGPFRIVLFKSQNSGDS